MAKVNHRIFEIYELRDEAGQSLISKSAQAEHDGTDVQSLDLQHLDVTRQAFVICVNFKKGFEPGGDTAAALRKDFSTLAQGLNQGSRVLVDFSNVEAFDATGVETLVQFGKSLQPKGSRMVICCLAPAVREVFFQAPPPPDRPPARAVNRSNGRNSNGRRGRTANSQRRG